MCACMCVCVWGGGEGGERVSCIPIQLLISFTCTRQDACHPTDDMAATLFEHFSRKRNRDIQGHLRSSNTRQHKKASVSLCPPAELQIACIHLQLTKASVPTISISAATPPSKPKRVLQQYRLLDKLNALLDQDQALGAWKLDTRTPQGAVRFGIKAYTTLVERIPALVRSDPMLKMRLVVEDLPLPIRELVHMHHQRQDDPHDKTASLEHDPVWRLLYTHQKDAVLRYLSNPNHRFLFNYEPGLGKTLIALMIMRCARGEVTGIPLPPQTNPNKTVLLVVPANLLPNWKNELVKFAKLSAPQDKECWNDEHVQAAYATTPKGRRIQSHTALGRARRKWEAARGAFWIEHSGLHVLRHANRYRLETDKINLISYSALVRHAALFLGKPRFAALIFDECHALKNQKSQQSKCAFKLARQSSSVVLLTGTVGNTPSHIFPQLRLVTTQPRLEPYFRRFATHTLPDTRTKQEATRHYACHAEGHVLVPAEAFAFADRYCGPKPVYARPGRPPLVEYKGSSHLEELTALLNLHPNTHRLLKRDAGIRLPPQTSRRLVLGAFADETHALVQERLDRCEQLRKKHKEAQAKYLLMDVVHSTYRQRIPYVLAGLLQLWDMDWPPTLGSGAKSHLARRFETPFVIFAHHIAMLKALQWFLTQLGLEIIYIDGSVSKAARDELVQRFQDPEAGVHAAVLSIGACNSGINLFRANQVVFAELVFDGCQILQAKDRVHRIGQTSPVTVHFMTIDKSGDDLLWRAVLKHIGVMSKIVDHASNRAVNYGIPSTQLPECDPNQDAVAKAIQAAWSAQNQTEPNDQPSGLPNLDLTLQTS